MAGDLFSYFWNPSQDYFYSWNVHLLDLMLKLLTTFNVSTLYCFKYFRNLFLEFHHLLLKSKPYLLFKRMHDSNDIIMISSPLSALEQATTVVASINKNKRGKWNPFFLLSFAWLHKYLWRLIKPFKESGREREWERESICVS